MKKAAIFILSLCLILALGACGNDGLYKAPTAEATQAETLPGDGQESAASGEGTDTAVSDETAATEVEPSYEVQDVDSHVMYVTADTQLNVRKGPSTDTESVYALNRGDRVTVTGVSGDWSRIDLNGEPYFVKTEFLSDVQPVAEAPVDSVSTGHVVCIDPDISKAAFQNRSPTAPGPQL